MNNPHIVRKSTSPVSAPPEAGIHWINTSTGEEYFSVGTSNINDWIIRKNNGDWLNGSGVPSSSLGNNNDNYINNDNGDYYKKVSGSWVIQGNLAGPIGATGATGATGPSGADGSQIYTGSGSPSSLLGVNSDFYVDTASNNYYQKESGSWVLKGAFAGVSDHGMLTGLADNDHPQYLLKTVLETQNLAEKEPTGFENRTDSSISFNDGTRNFSINPTVASFSYWVRGTKYTIASGVTISEEISTTTGSHYIYFDINGNIQSTTSYSPELFTDNCMIAIVYWNNTTNSHVYFADERHGMQMDGATHGYLHTVFGTRYLSGLALQGFDADGDGSSNAHAQFASDSGTIRDEDIVHTISSQSQFPILYRIGTDWRKKTADSYPVIYNGTAGYTGARIAYNNFSAGSWSLAEATNGNYILMHVFATNDVDNHVVAILGTTQYANAPQARAGADTEIGSLSGLPFAEFTAIGTVIFQTNSAYTNVPKARVISSDASIGETYVDYRGEQLYTPSGVATSHSLLSNLDADDHLQYFNESRGDARYVKKAGDTMAGPLLNQSGSFTSIMSSFGFSVNDGEPIATQAEMTHSYLAFNLPDGSDGYFSEVAGDHITVQHDVTAGIVRTQIEPETISLYTAVSGIGYVPATPTEPYHVTTKNYVDGQFQNTFMYSKNISYVKAVVANTSPSVLGCAVPSATGTAGAVTPNGASYYEYKSILQYTATAGSTAIAGWRWVTETFLLGSTAVFGGFKFSTGLGFFQGFTTGGTNRRFFCGFSAATTSPTDVNPSSLTDMFGFGIDNGDSNIQLMHNDGSGTATKIDTGLPRPTDKGTIYKIDINAVAGSGEVTLKIYNPVNGDSFTGTISSDIPATTNLLSPRAWMSAGGVSSAVGIAMEYIYTEN